MKGKKADFVIYDDQAHMYPEASEPPVPFRTITAEEFQRTDEELKEYEIPFYQMAKSEGLANLHKEMDAIEREIYAAMNIPAEFINKPIVGFTKLRCTHPCGCEEDPCPRHGARCTNLPLPLGLCAEHGCARCGGVILADTEDWPMPACADCYEKKCSWCDKLATAKGEDGTYSCGQGQGDWLEPHQNIGVIYAPWGTEVGPGWNSRHLGEKE